MNVTVQVYTLTSRVRTASIPKLLSQQAGMTSRTRCSTCLRVLRRGQRSSVLVSLLPSIPLLQAKRLTVVQSPQVPLQHNASRLFATSSPASASPVAPAKAPSPNALRQKTPDSPAHTKKTPQRVESSPTDKLAKAVRQRASAVTETYVAYGACESLVKECAAKADYSIPQLGEKGVEIPKTKDGEDLGVGTGWWYEGILQCVAPASRSAMLIPTFMQNWA